MGKTKGTYSEEFPVDSTIRITDLEALKTFRRDWKYHHPLQDEQLEFADREATVAAVSFYHGEDELYELAGVPGLWHEQLLSSTSPKT